MKNYKYLLKIDSPEDLKKIPLEELPIVCDEVRDFMIDTITKTGGHFGAGLGVVELTVALHYVFDTPTDKIVFDVGHQGYPHKILTGRRDALHTIRQKGGLSGFLKPSESEYDAFGVGHASTSISAALGMATARDLKGENFKVAAVIGDGSMTGGLAFEAMNNAGVQKRDIIVILNDNNMSIDANVSAFSNYFNEIFASSTVQSIRKNVWDLAGKLDTFGDRLRKLAGRIEEGMKAIITPGALFEAFGFTYFGPFNGHNVIKLVKILRLIKELKGPIFLHVMTQKGKGYGPAECDIHNLHAIGKIDKETGKSLSEKPSIPLYQDVFGETMVELCKQNENIIAITAAMCEGTGLDKLKDVMPERVIDVGIAEGHAVTFAAGLAIQGVLPVVAIYSSFLQRAYDNIIHDVALQNLKVIFAIDRAGLVGADGPTHHGVFDISYLRTIPNQIIAAPKDEQELRDLLFSAIYHYPDAPIAIRYPRGFAQGVPKTPMKHIPLGKSETLKDGENLAILAFGKMVSYSIKVAEMLEKVGISAAVVNARFAKPLDKDMLKDVLSRFEFIVTVEEGQKIGGFGSAVLEFANNIGIKPNILVLGIEDKFIEHGTQEELLEEIGLEEKGIYKRIVDFLENNHQFAQNEKYYFTQK
ncbi:MAG TPA: 1-deoxy-D-xylulose-5-phosphate synthase [Candidatus Kapabacteria bacterium]|jgi:1-deoxy-D-xylulose-5-phosphate synthase|nr:1-deoxy-D-xylulose-5-phosphate synthase [Candidatus Kapabacteria bacterium]